MVGAGRRQSCCRVQQRSVHQVNTSGRAGDRGSRPPGIGDLVEAPSPDVSKGRGNVAADVTDWVGGQPSALCVDAVQQLLAGIRVAGHRLAQRQERLRLQPQPQCRHTSGIKHV